MIFYLIVNVAMIQSKIRMKLGKWIIGFSITENISNALSSPGLISVYSILFLCSFSAFSQSQEEILRDLREDNVPATESKLESENLDLEKLRTIYLAVKTALENKEDKLAIEEAGKMEKMGINSRKMNVGGNAELTEGQTLYLKIRRQRCEAYYNLREFKNALPDSKFIVENHPRSVVFDFTRYAVSMYYSGNETRAKEILKQAKRKFKNQNDQEILRKTDFLLFPEY